MNVNPHAVSFGVWSDLVAICIIFWVRTGRTMHPIIHGRCITYIWLVFNVSKDALREREHIFGLHWIFFQPLPGVISWQTILLTPPKTATRNQYNTPQGDTNLVYNWYILSMGAYTCLYALPSIFLQNQQTSVTTTLRKLMAGSWSHHPEISPSLASRSFSGCMDTPNDKRLTIKSPCELQQFHQPHQPPMSIR